MTNQPRFLGILAAHGVETDWEAVYQSEMPRVFNFFRYRLGSDLIAEDLTSETFEKAWKNRARYRHDRAAFSTWLFTIARNTATDHFRKYTEEKMLDEVDHLSEHEELEGPLQEKDDFEHLSRLLALLPWRERELIALKYGAGLTNREIARSTGLTESNVGTILHRLTQHLREAWEDEE